MRLTEISRYLLFQIIFLMTHIHRIQIPGWGEAVSLGGPVSIGGNSIPRGDKITRGTSIIKGNSITRGDQYP